MKYWTATPVKVVDAMYATVMDGFMERREKKKKKKKMTKTKNR